MNRASSVRQLQTRSHLCLPACTLLNHAVVLFCLLSTTAITADCRRRAVMVLLMRSCQVPLAPQVKLVAARQQHPVT